MIGLLAASAFAIKPHFVLLWLAVEGYLRLTRRIGRWTLPPETVAITGILVLYGIAITVWAPDISGSSDSWRPLRRGSSTFRSGSCW